MKQFIAYWQKPVFPSASMPDFTRNRNRLLVFSALLAALAAIFQSAGGYLPGIGYFISPFATLPIVLAACLSVTGGFFAYIVTIGLLLMLQPAELFIFPFTTGLLGLAIGLSAKVLKRRLPVVLLSGIALFLGIAFVAFVLEFPIFGPSQGAGILIMLAVLGFSILYSYFWTEVSRFFFRRIFSIISQ